MNGYTNWKFTPSLSIAKTPGDRTWWTKSDRGHVIHTLAGLVLTDVQLDGRHLGQELHAVIGPLRFWIAMRFRLDALDDSVEI